MQDRSLVRASDIGAWAFCHRAWWLAHVRGVAHHRPAVLERGRTMHLAHGRAVLQAQRLQQLGLIILVISLLLAGFLLLLWLWLG